MNYLLLTLSLLMAFCATRTLGFTPSGRILVQHHSPLNKCYSSQQSSPSSPALFLVSGDEDDDFPSDDSTEYSGSVDWDAEWKKVVEKDDPLKDRPGKDFYKSEAEIAAIKAANTATKTVSESASSVANSLPDVRSLSGDWRFWIAILALVSVGLSLLSAPPADITSGLSADSFYV
jgi:hypothetical protein